MSFWRVSLVAVLAVAAWTASVITATAATYPPAGGPLVDDAHLLSEATRSALTDRLTKDNQAQTAQLAVAIVKTTGGVSIEDYALGLFNTWGVGHRDDNDGVLLVVFGLGPGPQPAHPNRARTWRPSERSAGQADHR